MALGRATSTPSCALSTSEFRLKQLPPSSSRAVAIPPSIGKFVGLPAQSPSSVVRDASRWIRSPIRYRATVSAADLLVHPQDDRERDLLDGDGVVDFAGGSSTPTSFSMVKQSFEPPFDKLPTNDWDKPNHLKPASGCELKVR